MNIQNTQSPDFDAIKAKQNAAWGSGDYAVIGNTLQIVGEQLAEAINLAPPSKVLDVAAGNGNATLAFARRWHEVVSTDYVESLLKNGAQRAEADGLHATFQTADAEDLPFDERSFDAVVSTFGVMFAPNQQQAAQEMARVCRSGGQIGMANWTPDSFIGALFKTLGGFVAPPAGVQSPANWGNEDWLRGAFHDAIADIRITARDFNFRYRSPAHFIDVFRRWYGPVHKAFAALDETGQRELEAAMTALIDDFNIETDGSMTAPGRYLEVVIDRA